MAHAGQPRKGILKHRASFDCSGSSVQHQPGGEAAASSSLTPQSECPTDAEGRKLFQWDEMNILRTYHPAGKDYGHMKIDEAPTPYEASGSDADASESESSSGPAGCKDHRRRASFSDAVQPDVLAQRLEETAAEVAESELGGSSEVNHDADADESELTEAEREHRRRFDALRRQHYNEFQAVLLARAKAAEEDDGEEEEEGEAAK